MVKKAVPDVVLDAATLFNLSDLSIHVPPSPLPTPPPSSTTRTVPGISAAFEDSQFAAVDDWVGLLAGEKEREEAYYDESLPFYLMLRLPTHTLSRSQALALLLPSLSSSHLTLSAELSYLEGTSHPYSSHTKDRNSVSSTAPAPFALDLSESISKIDSWPGARDGEEPGTPKPVPSGRKADANFAESSGVHVWSYAFVGGEAAEGEGRERGKFGNGRVWVGREGGDAGLGPWIGVWEFRGAVAFVKSPLTDPRLCLTVTMTFRDDPRLADLIERGAMHHGELEDVEVASADEDEYMVESFDDVNLLEGLDEELHLPASRLPLPPSTGANGGSSTPTTSSSRRPQFASHGRSGSFASNHDTPLYPAIRRAYRRVMKVRSALSCRMRTVPCPTFGIDRSMSETRKMEMEMGMEENGGEGMALCVEVEGIGERGGELGFVIDKIEVDVTGGAGAGDVEVKVVDGTGGEHSAFPIVLHPTDQFNFLYSVGYTGEDNYSAFDDHPSASVPIHVATSPSQRFSARFGDMNVVDLARPSEPIRRKAEASWIRNVGITVTGRPIRIPGKRGGELRSITSGYTVPGSINGTTASDSTSPEYPTTSFESRWNCTLDISPFAVRAESKRASFTPHQSTLPGSHVPFAAISSFSSTTGALKRRSKVPEPLEAIAGSKRHTIAGLASLVSKPSTLAKRGPTSAPLSLGTGGRAGDRSLPLPPPAPLEPPTPGATGPSRRFFSLPSGTSSTPPPPPSADSPNPTQQKEYFPRTESPQPTTEVRRETWSNRANDTAPSVSPSTHRSSSRTREGRQVEGDAERMVSRGNILVSVSLVPLRDVKGKGPIDLTSPSPIDIPTFSDPFSPNGDVQVVQRKTEAGWRTPRVGLLDVFLVEVFVLNRGDTVKRFTVGVPPRRGEGNETSHDRIATIVALENDVRIGPLAPQTCQSVRLRFLAVRPGAHTIDELRLTDVATGWETILKNPVGVVVEG